MLAYPFGLFSGTTYNKLSILKEIKTWCICGNEFQGSYSPWNLLEILESTEISEFGNKSLESPGI